MVTGAVVEQYVTKRLTESGILPITGGIYPNDEYTERPFNSQDEDCVVRFMTGNSEQVQEGIVVVNVFIPDIQNRYDGMYYKSRKCETIENVLMALPDLLTHNSDYLFVLNQAISTFEETSIKQHYVSAKLRFKTL